MRFATVVVLLFSATALAAPIQDFDQVPSIQDLTSSADAYNFPTINQGIEIPDFADAAEFIAWAEVNDLDSLDPVTAINVAKKVGKVLYKCGVAVMENGPKIIDTLKSIKKSYDAQSCKA